MEKTLNFLVFLGKIRFQAARLWKGRALKKNNRNGLVTKGNQT